MASYKAIGLAFVDILKDTDIPDFVNCWRLVLLDYVAQNAKGGLDEDFIKQLPVMCNLLNEVECIPNELPDEEN